MGIIRIDELSKKLNSLIKCNCGCQCKIVWWHYHSKCTCQISSCL